MYATQSDLERRFGVDELVQLTDRASPPAGVIDAAVLEEALGAAASEIDGYIAMVYARPLTVVPPRLVNLACDIARYHLYTHAAPELVTERYKAAVAFLRLVASGDASLGLPDKTSGETTDLAEISTGRRLFARGDRR